jgi:hypothetical protein
LFAGQTMSCAPWFASAAADCGKIRVITDVDSESQAVAFENRIRRSGLKYGFPRQQMGFPVTAKQFSLMHNGSRIEETGVLSFNETEDEHASKAGKPPENGLEFRGVQNERVVVRPANITEISLEVAFRKACQRNVLAVRLRKIHFHPC